MIKMTEQINVNKSIPHADKHTQIKTATDITHYQTKS